MQKWMSKQEKSNFSEKTFPYNSYALNLLKPEDFHYLGLEADTYSTKNFEKKFFEIYDTLLTDSQTVRLFDHKGHMLTEGTGKVKETIRPQLLDYGSLWHADKLFIRFYYGDTETILEPEGDGEEMGLIFIGEQSKNHYSHLFSRLWPE